MSQTILQTDLYLVNPESIPKLQVWKTNLKPGVSDYLTQSLKFALQRETKGLWAANRDRLLFEGTISQAELKTLLEKLWQSSEQFYGVVGFEETDDVLSSWDQAEWTAHSLTNMYLRDYLKSFDHDFDRVKVNYSPMLQACVFEDRPCLSLGVEATLSYTSHLAELMRTHDPIGYQVKGILDRMKGQVVEVLGELGPRRDELLKKTSNEKMRRALSVAPAEMPIVAVDPGRSKHPYDYIASALQPILSPGELKKIGIRDTREIMNALKLPPDKRLKMVNKIVHVLREEKKLLQVVSSRDFSKSCFQLPSAETLMIGKSTVCSSEPRTLLPKLKQNGLFSVPTKQTLKMMVWYQLGANVNSSEVSECIKALKEEVKHFGVEIINAPIRQFKIQDGSVSEIHKALVEFTRPELKPDLVLAILPDEGDELEPEQSLYLKLKQALLAHDIQSQMMTHQLFQSRQGLPRWRDALSNLALGILAKSGAVPYVLARPLTQIDYVVGLDISRQRKRQSQGSMNTAASARVFMNNGELLTYQLVPTSSLEGETFDLKLIRALFPYQQFENKRIIVHRDGPLRGAEKKHFESWGQELKSQFHLVEIIKQGSPRIYQLNGDSVQGPEKGWGICLNGTEALLVSSLPPYKGSTPRPLRIRTDGSISLKKAIESVHKLSFLHYGSVRQPRLPVTVHYSDQIAWLASKGVSPTSAQGKLPFWI